MFRCAQTLTNRKRHDLLVDTGFRHHSSHGRYCHRVAIYLQLGSSITRHARGSNVHLVIKSAETVSLAQTHRLTEPFEEAPSVEVPSLY